MSDSSMGLLFSLLPLPPHACFQKGGGNRQIPIKEKVNACVAFNEMNPLWQVRVKLLLEVLWRYCQGHLILLWGLRFAPERHVCWHWKGERRQEAQQPDEAAGPRATETSPTETAMATVALVGSLLKFGT